MADTTDSTVQVFCSYAPEDEKWLRKLEEHLSPLWRQGLISLSHKRLISPGIDWTQDIDKQLEDASIILLLISANFFASNYCYGIEMNRALERQKKDEAQVIPILVRSVHWEVTPLSHLKVLPSDAIPIAGRSNVDKAFSGVVAGIRRAIEDFSRLAASPPHAAASPFELIPYAHNRFFIGREDLLDQLHECLPLGERRTVSHPQAISGLAGMGKTQLAVKYAYRYAQHYQRVLWAQAENIEALNSSFTPIARFLELPECNAQKQEVINEAVRYWLKTNENWLLILDNADDLNLVFDYLNLPFPLRGHLLITTQDQNTATEKLAQRLEVKGLDREQGAELLLRRALGLFATDASLGHVKHSDWELAMKISDTFEGLPLALDQAGAYLEETGVELNDYWRQYQLKTDYTASVATTLLLSFQKVQKKQPAAAKLLQLCAFLAPDAIPEKLVEQDTVELRQAVEGLRAYSLIHYDSQDKTLSIHRLVQDVMYEELSAEEREKLMQRAVTLVNDTFSHPDQVSRELLLPHALVCEKWIKQAKMVSPEAADLLCKTGYYLYEHARYTEAEPLYKHCRDIRVQDVGDYDHPDVAQSLSDLANLYSELGRYAKAEKLLTRSLDIWERNWVYDHPAVARLLNNLAILCKVRGRDVEAEKLLTRSLGIWKQSPEPADLDVAKSGNNLAVLYAELHRDAEAEALFKSSKDILQRERGYDHLEVALSLSNLAHFYTEQGKNEQAWDFYKHSENIFEEKGRSKHSDAAYLLNCRGILFMKQGKYAKAEERDKKYKEAEESFASSKGIWEPILGPEHSQVAYSFHNLAVLYIEQGRYAEAEERDKKYEKAKDWFDHSLDIWEEKLGPEHIHTQTCAKNYAILLHILKRDVEALELARQYNFTDEPLDEDKLVAISTFRSFRL